MPSSASERRRKAVEWFAGYFAGATNHVADVDIIRKNLLVAFGMDGRSDDARNPRVAVPVSRDSVYRTQLQVSL